MIYVFQKYPDVMKLVGKCEKRDPSYIHFFGQDEVVEMLVSRFKKERTKNPDSPYPFMTLVAVAEEIGIDREDETVDLAWDKV